VFREAVLPTAVNVDDLQFFSITAGRAVEIPVGPSTSPRVSFIVSETGASIPVDRREVQGAIESLDGGSKRAYRLDLAGQEPRGGDWLQIQAERSTEDTITLTDGSGGPRHLITAWIPAGEGSIDLMVGNCPQWFGYSERPVYVIVEKGSELENAALLTEPLP
jgi:hypothetical protein